jgi:hypothetical protein
VRANVISDSAGMRVSESVTARTSFLRGRAWLSAPCGKC